MVTSRRIISIYLRLKGKHVGGSFVLIILGILSAAMGLKGFLLSSKFIDGGVTGISMLTAEITGIPLSILIFVINIPFLILGYKRLGILFAIKSAMAIAGLSLCLAFVHFPDVTHDKLLTAVFGGFFIGVGIGRRVAHLDHGNAGFCAVVDQLLSRLSSRCHR